MNYILFGYSVILSALHEKTSANISMNIFYSVLCIHEIAIDFKIWYISYNETGGLSYLVGLYVKRNWFPMHSQWVVCYTMYISSPCYLPSRF